MRIVIADDSLLLREGLQLLLTEAGTEKKAGVWVVAGDPATQAPLAELGPEADALDEATLARLLADHPMRLHGFLRDQHAAAPEEAERDALVPHVRQLDAEEHVA